MYTIFVSTQNLSAEVMQYHPNMELLHLRHTAESLQILPQYPVFLYTKPPKKKKNWN